MMWRLFESKNMVGLDGQEIDLSVLLCSSSFYSSLVVNCSLVNIFNVITLYSPQYHKDNDSR